MKLVVMEIEADGGIHEMEVEEFGSLRLDKERDLVEHLSKEGRSWCQLMLIELVV